ncbi:MAG TPA: hypothetical protein VG738_10830 [Chitinophagaceae bacterium]|nr:hypothetical protein [Chitinophagaceae bacterium]
MRKKSFLMALGICFLFLGNQTHAQQMPGKLAAPVVFEPGKISDAFPNRDMAISPDGRELFYTIQFTKGYFSVIMHCIKKNGEWSEPEMAAFSGRYSDLEPSFSPDGTKLYFSSDRPLTDTGAEKDFDIWFVTKVNGVWQNPQNMGAPVNTTTDEFYASVAKSGNIYFTRATEGRNDDIKMCRFVNGSYDDAVSLSDSVNSAGYEFNAYVDPDEQFILYTAYNRPGGLGSGDLYISRKTAEGGWGRGVNLVNLNSPYMDYCPFVTADKKYLYFTSDRPALETPFKKSADAKTIRAILNSPGNRFDDIYVVPFDALLVK